jgi:hypothetical protein
VTGILSPFRFCQKEVIRVNPNMLMNRDMMKSTAWGAGVGAAGGAGLTATIGGVTVAIVGTPVVMPVIAAGAVLGGLVGVAYGLGRQMPR